MDRWQKRSIFLIGFSLLMAISGCSGGGGSSSSTDTTVTLSPLLDTTAEVTFPENSPLDFSNASITLADEEISISSTNTASVSVYADRLNQLSIFLPSRDGGESPTLYLTTTVVPGERNIRLNVEETAIALIMAALSAEYTDNVQTASYTKYIVSKHAADFVSAFRSALADDPYMLRADNLPTLLSSLLADSYAAAINAADSELGTTFNSLTTTSVAPLANLYEPVVYEEDFGNFILKSDALPPFGGLTLIPPNSLTSEELVLLNGSMIPVLTRITDTSSDIVIKDIPAAFADQAFSGDILSPSSGPFGLQLPNWENINSGNKNLLVEIYSPGLRDITNSHYSDTGSPSAALLARAVFSSAILPVIGAVVPGVSGDSNTIANDVAEVIFSTLYSAGAFEHILYYWPQGEYVTGLEKTYNSLSNAALMSAIINKLIEKELLKPETTAKLIALLAVKFTAAEYAIASAAISINSLTHGLLNTPSKVTFQVVYPVGLHDLYPTSVEKLPSDQVSSGNTQDFVLSGHGFSPVEFNGDTYYATLQLEAFAADGTSLGYNTLGNGEYTRQPCGTECTGDAIIFRLPDYLLDQSTNAHHVEITLHHYYIEPGYLADYTDWFNDLESISLPVFDSARKKYTVYLTQDVEITAIEPSVVTTGSAVTITGTGFASGSGELTNEVLFTDYNGDLFAGYLSSESDTEIRTDVDEDIDLNDHDTESYRHIGSGSVYVALSDGSESNAVLIQVVPKTVTFSPEPVIGDMTDRGTLISLNQVNGLPVYYSQDGGPLIEYSAPIEITSTTTISAHAQLTVDGVIYPSAITSRSYVSCLEGQTYIRYPHGPSCEYIENEELMTIRYCPLYETQYSGNMATPYGTATCSYSLSSLNLARENHIAADGSTLLESTQYWDEPAGRPMYIWRPYASYNFCPDGSFLVVGESCESH